MMLTEVVFSPNKFIGFLGEVERKELLLTGHLSAEVMTEGIKEKRQLGGEVTTSGHLCVGESHDVILGFHLRLRVSLRNGLWYLRFFSASNYIDVLWKFTVKEFLIEQEHDGTQHIPDVAFVIGDPTWKLQTVRSDGTCEDMRISGEHLSSMTK